MIKKQQKWIAVLVILTFLGLLQVSAMPLAAASTSQQIAAAGAEQGPRAIEEEGSSSFVGKKKSILPIVLIGVGVVALAAVLFLVVLKTSYNIIGTWDCDYTDSSFNDNFQIVFSGTKESGTWTLIGWTDTGTYTVDGKAVRFVFDEEPWVFTGEFTDKDKMSGNHSWPAISLNGTWSATRVGGATSTAVTQASKSLVEEVKKTR